MVAIITRVSEYMILSVKWAINVGLLKGNLEVIGLKHLKRDFKEVGKEGEILDESKDRMMALREEIRGMRTQSWERDDPSSCPAWAAKFWSSVSAST